MSRRRYPGKTAAFLEKSARLINEDEVRELIPNVIRDIPIAMADLESMRTEANRSKVAWIETILGACFLVARQAH